VYVCVEGRFRCDRVGLHVDENETLFLHIDSGDTMCKMNQ